MEFERKYIEVESEFDVDDAFVDSIQEVGVMLAIMVMNLIEANVDRLYVDEKESDMAAGIIKSNRPIYFAIEYYKMDNYIPIIIDFDIISSDDYLDMMLDDKVILQ
tara:strand:- start:387 stop:704 length:318 start_codon:yes stop_codon:yes gene_type:complete